MERDDWHEMGERAADVGARLHVLESWTPDLVVGAGACPFEDYLRAGDPALFQLLIVVERQFRGGTGTDINVLRAHFDTLVPATAASMLVDFIRLNQIRHSVGIGPWEIKGRAESWFQSFSVSVFAWLSRQEMSLTPRQFLEMVNAFYQHIAKNKPISGAGPSGWAPWGTYGVQLIERCSASVEDREVVERWLATLVDPLDRAAERFRDEPITEFADLQNAVISALGQQSKTPTIAQKLAAPAREARAAQLKKLQDVLEEPRTPEVVDPRKEERRTHWAGAIQWGVTRALRLDISLRPVPFDTALTSYVGGHPRLPAEIGWPETKTPEGQSFAQPFRCQIDLAKLPITRNSPLPQAGRLLFFDSAVLYLPEETPVAPFREPPHNVPASREPEQWLASDDPLRRSDFCYPIRFAPLDTYCDTEDGAGVVGWRNDTKYEREYARLARRAAVKSLKLFDAPKRHRTFKNADTWPISELYGGPYTVLDARCLLACSVKEITKFHAGQPWSAPLKLIGPDIELELQSWRMQASNLLMKLSGKEDWIALEREHVDAIRGYLSNIGKSIKTLQERAQARTLTLKQEWLETLPADRPETQPVSIFYLPYYLSDVAPLDGLIQLNIRRAAHLGYDPSAVYPPDLVDWLAPDFDVERWPQEYHDEHSAPRFDQMLGWGRSVQAAPAENIDKIMLLQIFGGSLRWLSNSSCVAQYWISPDALRQRRFGDVRLTVECN